MERTDLRGWGIRATIAVSVVLGVASLVWPAIGLTLLVAGFALFAVGVALYAIFELGVLAYYGEQRATGHVAPDRPEDMRVTIAPWERERDTTNVGAGTTEDERR